MGTQLGPGKKPEWDQEWEENENRGTQSREGG